MTLQHPGRHLQFLKPVNLHLRGITDSCKNRVVTCDYQLGKGTGLTGLYTKLSRDSIHGVNGIYPYDIAISNQGGYVIDSSGLEFNIKKEGKSESTGDYAEGDFQFNLLNQVGLTDAAKKNYLKRQQGSRALNLFRNLSFIPHRKPPL